MADTVIEEEDTEGRKFVRFQPLPAWETPAAVDELCAAFERASTAGQMDQLILILMFILDFLCIHPFDDGNGRMSRLLTLLLLYRAGYIVVKYISIDYMDGIITREQFWVLVKFKYPTHQINFCTQDALKCLQYRGYEEVQEI